MEKIQSSFPIERTKPHTQRADSQATSLQQFRIADTYQPKIDQPHVRDPAILANQFMTSPVFMHLPTSSVSKAWEAKREKRFRHITILSSQGLLVGSLSDRDLFRATLEIFTSPDQSGGDVQQMPIQQIMVRNVLSATPETEIRAIARILFEEHIEAMPIMMERDDLVGILT